MAVTIRIGYTSDDPKVVNKTVSLNGDTTCRIKGDCDVESPTFILNSSNSYITSNYVYCPTWGKYYFITKPPTVSEGGAMELHCEEDVLMTFKDTIKASEQMITRQEYDFDNSLPDNMLPISARTQTIVKRFGEDMKSTEHYILGVC